MFGVWDLVVRWVVPAGMLLALVVRSWPLAVGAGVIFVVAWILRARQFPRIGQGEMAASLERGPIGQSPGPPYMRPYYESWPLLHKSYGHPMVVEPVDVFCPEHLEWESGEIEAMVSPGAFLDSVNLNIDFDYGGHSWRLDVSTSMIHRGVGDFGGRHGDLWEVRARNVVDKNLYDGANHALAVAMLLPVENSWGLVLEHLESLGHWEGLDTMNSEMQVAIPD
jgi:hypothetical protein